MEKRVKRLEITVVALIIMLFISISISIYGVLQVAALTSKIPSYKEIKEDVKILKDVYVVTKEKAPVVKDAIVDSYEYTKGKTNDVINYFKADKDEK
jgi:hypothetical protein